MPAGPIDAPTLLVALLLLLAAVAALWRFGPDLLLRAGVALLPRVLRLKVRRIGILQWPAVDGGAVDGPPLVALHGFGVCKETLAPLLATLAAERRVVAPDLPGFGANQLGEALTAELAAASAAVQGRGIETLADAIGAPPSAAAWAYIDAVAAWIEEAFDRPVDLLGASMGGAIAASIAARRPDLVRSLLLLGPAGVVAPVRNPFMQAAEEGRNLLEIQTLADLDRVLALNFVKVPWIPRPVRRALARDLRRRGPQQRAILEALAPLLVGGVTPLLPRIAAPTLVLWGGADQILDPSGAEVYRRGVPHAEVLLVADAGHTLQNDQPREVTARIGAFLLAVGEGGGGAPG